MVTTVGFDYRQWVDGFGYPISDKAVLEERYSRPSRSRLRLDMTLTGPVNYPPWHSSPKTWGPPPADDCQRRPVLQVHRTTMPPLSAA